MKNGRKIRRKKTLGKRNGKVPAWHFVSTKTASHEWLLIKSQGKEMSPRPKQPSRDTSVTYTVMLRKAKQGMSRNRGEETIKRYHSRHIFPGGWRHALRKLGFQEREKATPPNTPAAIVKKKVDEEIKVYNNRIKIHEISIEKKTIIG